MNGLPTVIIVSALFILCFALVKAEERYGLGGFSTKLLGSSHGDLVNAIPAKNATPPQLSLVFTKALLLPACAFVILLGTVFAFTSDRSQAVNTLINLIFPVITVGAAFSAYQSRGAIPAILGSIIGFAGVALVIFAVTANISVEIGRPVVDQVTLNGLHGLFGLIGAALGVAMMPAQCQFKRVYSDGFSDMIWVSNRSLAFRAYRRLAA